MKEKRAKVTSHMQLMKRLSQEKGGGGGATE